jgi:mRNA-degrading endonuclease HigB of HigAB toxin-antitoxin module
MKLVGKRHVAEFDGPPMAKRRLTLWCREVAAAKWRSLEDLQSEYRRASPVRGNLVRFDFEGEPVFVEAAISFIASVVFIERVGHAPVQTA